MNFTISFKNSSEWYLIFKTTINQKIKKIVRTRNMSTSKFIQFIPF